MGRYSRVIEKVFIDNHREGSSRVPFGREMFDAACDSLKLRRIKNLGDIVYSFRFRAELPNSIQSKAPEGYEWIILGAGRALYEFRLATSGKISVGRGRQEIKIPDSTPEIIKMYAPGDDEQALLTKVRYNRIIDLFTGLSCYSVQNHYRTTVTGMGQIEVDEIYVGISKTGAHFILPCQAKSPGDNFGVVQVYQDMKLCEERYSSATCRPMAFQFTGKNSLAVLELIATEEDDILTLSVVDEKHYRLVPKDDISESDLTSYHSTMKQS